MGGKVAQHDSQVLFRDGAESGAVHSGDRLQQETVGDFQTGLFPDSTTIFTILWMPIHHDLPKDVLSCLEVPSTRDRRHLGILARHRLAERLQDLPFVLSRVRRRTCDLISLCASAFDQLPFSRYRLPKRGAHSEISRGFKSY